jgi:hypothetical protein
MGTQDQDKGKQQAPGSENRPGQQQGANQPGGRQQGQDPAGNPGSRQQGGGAPGSGRQQEQQGDRQPGQTAKDDGISDDDIDERKDAGSLGQKGEQGRKDQTR